MGARLVRPSLPRQLTLLVAAAGLVSLLTAGWAFASYRRALTLAEGARGKHADDLILCHEMSALLERKLAKSRSFILTADEEFSQEMEDARSQFASILGRLTGSLRGGGPARLSRIGALEARHHQILRRVMAQRRGGARPSDLTPALLERLKPVRDELDAEMRALIALKEEKLAAAEEAAEAGMRLARRVSAGAGLASLAVFGFVIWVVRRLALVQVEVERGLRLSNAELDDIVAERTRELSAFNRELESFSYSVAHDLRTPLRSVTNFSQVAAARSAGDPALKEDLARIRAAGMRMSHLIDALLSLSRLTRRPLAAREADLTDMARELDLDLRASYPDRSVAFSVMPGLVDSGDPELLRVALRNLLENAWKFTAGRPDARVEFGRAVVEKERAYFVRDNGAGFDPRFADKLFRPFERLHSTEEFRGTGIGLATVERVIRRHGGRVWAEGEPGKGATFYFTLGGADVA
jgi:signal transduction histidine kinase